MKPETCIGCELYSCPGPVLGEFTAAEVAVLFVGEALGAVEVQQRRPMVGEAGRVLRKTIEVMHYDSYGITNVWRCRPPGNELPSGEPAEFCKQGLIEDLSRATKIVIPLGTTALQAITGRDMGITQVQGRMFSSGERILLPMYHPSYLRRNGYYWRDWELAHAKLRDFLDGKTDYIPPERREITMPRDSVGIVSWLRELSKPEYVVLDCDIETSAGYAPWAGSRILSMSIGWSKTRCIAFMWSDLSDEARELLAKLLSDPGKSWGWYNGQYDSQFLWAEGFAPRIDWDAMVEVHLVDERGSSDESVKGGVYHSLKRDAGILVDASDWEFDVKQYAPRREDSYEAVPPERLLTYNGFDAIYTRHVSEVCRRYMTEEQTLDYYWHVVMPTYNMLSRARYVGFRIDMYRVKELQERMKPVLEELTQRMTRLAGSPFFTPGSPQQVKKVLWDRGLKVENTRKETMQEYEGDEFVDAMRDYRDCSKMLSTYVVGLVDDVYNDLRVHPDWRMPTETGRPRCSNPNLLGMPRKTEEIEHKWKRFIKEQFIADKGKVLMHLDRRQSEVRCMVFLADCVKFIESLIANPNADIHGEFTKMLYGTGYTHEQRVLVKMIVFGLIYNREALSLAVQFTAIEREKARREGRDSWRVWSIREAQRFIDDFFRLFPEMLTYKNLVMRQALSTGVLRGYMGRLRRFGLVNYDNQKSIRNQAVNFMPSNLSADLNFLSCVETMRQFGKYGVEVLVPIHDSGLLSAPKDSLYLKDEIQALWEGLVYKELTRSGLPLERHNPNIPFPVDVTVGERWSDL